MDEYEIKFVFECEECGSNLAVSLDGSTIYVEPCEKCLARAHDSGYDEGLEDKELADEDEEESD